MDYTRQRGSETLGTGVGAATANARAALMLVATAGSAAVTVGRGLLNCAQRFAGELPMSPRDRHFIRELPQLLGQHGYRYSTIRKYVGCVARFLSWRHLHRREGSSPAAVAEFLAHLRRRGAGDAVLRLHLGALRTVFDRCLAAHLTQGIDYAPRPLPIQPASGDTVACLLAAADARQNAIIALCAGAGLRPRELALLTWSQIDHGAGMVRVTRGRRPKVLQLVLPETALAALARHRARLREQTDYVFPGRHNDRPISIRAIEFALQRLREQTGVDATLTALAAVAQPAELPQPRPFETAPRAALTPYPAAQPGWYHPSPRAPPFRVRPTVSQQPSVNGV